MDGAGDGAKEVGLGDGAKVLGLSDGNRVVGCMVGMTVIVAFVGLEVGVELGIVVGEGTHAAGLEMHKLEGPQLTGFGHMRVPSKLQPFEKKARQVRSFNSKV